MKKYLVLVAVALSVGFTACDDDEDVIKPVVSIVNESEVNSVAQLDTLYLKAKMENVPAGTKSVWTVNGKEVSTSSSYKFTQPKPGEYAIGLAMADVNGEKIQSVMTAKVYARFGKGAFVLNEGNMTNETGTLGFIDRNGVLVDSAYYRVNQSLLGAVCQDMFIANNKVYILSQNGAKNGGEGLLTIANAETLEKELIYNDDANKLSWPTHLAAVGENIYIRDNNGVQVLNASTKEIVTIDGSRGIAKNHMVTIGGKVFAINGKKICVIQDKAIVKTIELSGSLSGLARAYDGNLWASCTSPGQIMKINPEDYSVIDTHTLNVSVSNNYGSAPAIAAREDTLYFCQGASTLYRHIFKEDKTETVANIQEYLPDAKTYYNSLGVDPESGKVYLATLKGWGQDYKINDIGIFDFSRTPAMQQDYKNKNSFPAGVYFTANFE
ncbi:DUF5074 domain-containing protein [Bacteroides sp.]|uniref:DUF5074 domain-containing protein n=1 Tax=Bacteroides sp. TaxID=29523 RepID=UPI00261A3DEC|nr:DUF5074 domain-containing protein [Bacteroides sp.]MDD3038660.1 DUF5074 domain-containing protein [Bacteroides sp.]